MTLTTTTQSAPGSESGLRLEQLVFDNRYARLPEEFWHAVAPQPLLDAHLVSFNEQAAALIGLGPGEARRPDFVDFFSGKRSWPGFEPLAMCYSGHQFGVYVPRLGDGRAVLLGQVRNHDGALWDIQVKGSGPTRYSRQGDGRAVLRSSIREYLCSEAMAGLGIPTTRALCLIGSRQAVYREQVEPGAMLVRLAESHIRFGSFEYFFYTGQHDHLRQLADYVLQQHYPQLLDHEQPYLALLDEIIQRTADLIARWQGVGFTHGVMNSDNMSVLGLTLDYGPFGFLDTFQAGYVCNHSDHQGRYAFREQPDIGLFNLGCLAQALLPLLSDNKDQAMALARASLDNYWSCYEQAYRSIVRAKLGLLQQHKGDHILWLDLLRLLEGRLDYTHFFRALCGFDSTVATSKNGLCNLFIDRQAFVAWAERYRLRLLQEGSDDVRRSRSMKAVNPKYILRNYLAERAIRQAEDEGDYTEISRLLELLKQPFAEQPGFESYAATPPEWAGSISVSCSS